MKTKALVSCAVTSQLICAFVFAYADVRFAHDATQIIIQCTVPVFFSGMKSIDTKDLKILKFIWKLKPLTCFYMKHSQV